MHESRFCTEEQGDRMNDHLEQSIEILQDRVACLMKLSSLRAAKLVHNAAGHFLVQLGQPESFYPRFSFREYIWKKLGI